MKGLVWTLAVRLLWSARRQSALAAGVVAVSVALVVFLNALIGGLQRRLLETTTGSIMHILVARAARELTAVWSLPDSAGSLYVGTRSTLELRSRVIDDWPNLARWLQGLDPEVLLAVPTAEGPGLAVREARRESVRVVGADPDLYDRALRIQERLSEGRYVGLAVGEAVVGARLAEKLGVTSLDRFRVTGPGGSSTLRVVGILLAGSPALDDGVVLVNLRQAQLLLGLGSGVTNVGVRLRRAFEADRVAARIAAGAPVEVRSWMQENRQLLAGLRAQSQSSFLIQAFVTLAAGFGIVSILITNVLARLRAIGILRAMGATKRQITLVFAVQGVVLALTGGIVGGAAGAGLSLLFYRARLAASGPGIEVFPVDLNPQLVAVSVALSVVVGGVASLIPARHAARVDPIHVIRTG